MKHNKGTSSMGTSTRGRTKVKKLAKMKTDTLLKETEIMEKRLSEMKLYLEMEANKTAKRRFGKSIKGPIRNYGKYVVNKHKGIETDLDLQGTTKARQVNLRTGKRKRRIKRGGFKVKKIAINSAKMSTNGSMISTDLESQRVENFYLSEITPQSEIEQQLIANISKNIMGRVDGDKRDYENFLEERGLMKYYDMFFDIGVSSLDELSKMTVEDFNNLFIPMGHQIKIEKGLKKLGYAQVEKKVENASAAIATDDIQETIPKEGGNYVNGRLNFGIKVKKKGSRGGKKVGFSAGGEGEGKKSVQVGVGSAGDKPGMSSFGGGTDDLPPLQPHELNINREMTRGVKSKGILKNKGSGGGNRFKNAIMQVEEKKVKKAKKGKGKKAKVVFDLNKNQSQAERPRFNEENLQQGSKSNFSFASFGGFNWTNKISTQQNEDIDTIDLSTPVENKIAYPSDYNTEIDIKKKKICCYNCLNFLVKTQSETHPKIPDKYFCTVKCKNEATERYLQTCESCFNLFNKAKKGIPVGKKWTCSQKCKTKISAPKQRELRQVKSMLRNNRMQIQEMKYQENKPKDIDLGMDFELNF